MVELVRGNLLDSDARALVVPVNCQGIMGSGLALAFRDRFPAMHADYTARCEREAIHVGQVSAFRGGAQMLVYFPVAERWRGPSRLDIMEAGLRSLRQLIRRERISSIALPALGCGRGRLRWADVRPRIVYALGGLPNVSVMLHAPMRPAWCPTSRVRSA